MSVNFSLKTLFSAFAIAMLIVVSSCNHEDNKIKETCFDEILNNEEQRIDCGGPNCDPCPPTCDDGVQNQDETAPDCGGPNCPPCGTCDDGIQNAVWVPSLQAFFMESGIDCGFPCPNYCAPSCEDGIQNGDETGVDCGGALCVPCPPPTCFDGVWNGLETGVDCGGPLCAPCAMASCSDGIQNQGEEGIDCGGPCSTICPIPSCTDGVQNQGETGIDCGGPCPTICPPASCNYGVLNNGETWIDCGGPCPTVCPACDDGVQNGPEAGVDCIYTPIPDYFGGLCNICPSCIDGMLNQLETAVDCGGPFCSECEMYLNIGSLNGFPFVGSDFSVSVAGLDILFTASETLNGQLRTVTLKLPINLAIATPTAVLANPAQSPSMAYDQFGTNFLSIAAGSGNCNYDLHNTTPSSGPKRLEGTIDNVVLQNGLPPTASFTNAVGITYGVNY
jgi:hypothetical protein